MNTMIIKNKNVAILVIGKAISMLGSNIQQFALSLYVYVMTGSATLFASMLAISILPRLLFTPFAGVFGDWFDRKKMIVMLDYFNAFVIMGYALYMQQAGVLDLWMIYALIIILETTELFYEAASAGIAPSIVKKEELLSLKALVSMVLNAARMLSPLIGALVFGLYGLLAVLFINAISFFFAATMEIFLNVPPLHNGGERKSAKVFIEDFKGGLSVIRNDKQITSIILLATTVNFLIGPLFAVGFIVIIMDVLSASEVQFGFFQSMIAFSMVIGPLFVHRFSKRFNTQQMCIYGFVAIGLVISLIAIIPSTLFLNMFTTNMLPFTILMFLTVIIGLIASVVNVSLSTLFAQIVPIEAMGRTSSIMHLLATLFIPIGQILYGVLFDRIAPSVIIVGVGLSLLLSVILLKNMLMKSAQPPINPEKDVVYEI